MRTVLNKKNSITVKKIHLLTTPLCTRDCPNCCNKLYDFESIPCVTTEELNQCKWLFLTGGEPFEFVNPDAIAEYYKQKFKNIKKVIVYGNVYECHKYLERGGSLRNIDGVSLSIKNQKDRSCFEFVAKNPQIQFLQNNRLYVFMNLMPKESYNLTVFSRTWQPLEEYKPAPDSIFKRM